MTAETLKIFISHAGGERAGASWFAEDLEHQIRQESPEPIEVDIFVADSSIDRGADWRAEIQEFLDTCHFFIPICTHRFFGSKYCALEWGFFQRRLYRGTRSDERPPTRIIPVIWRPIRHIPAILESIHLPATRVAPEVEPPRRRTGIVDWQASSRLNGPYLEYVLTLAREISDSFAADRRILPSIDPLRWTDAEPAFITRYTTKGQGVVRLTYAIPTIAYVATQGASADLPEPTTYGDNHRRWSPFRGSSNGSAGSPDIDMWEARYRYPERLVDWQLRRYNLRPASETHLPREIPTPDPTELLAAPPDMSLVVGDAWVSRCQDLLDWVVELQGVHLPTSSGPATAEVTAAIGTLGRTAPQTLVPSPNGQSGGPGSAGVVALDHLLLGLSRWENQPLESKALRFQRAEDLKTGLARMMEWLHEKREPPPPASSQLLPKPVS